MRSFSIIAMLAISFGLVGCQSQSTGEPTAPKVVKLDKGQPVELMLLAPIESGDCPKGMVVNLALAKDLVDSSGNVVLPAGSPFVGEITWSRAAGAVSALINQPARLAMMIRPTKLASGETLVWTSQLDAKEPEAYEFTLENVGAAKADAKVESALAEQSKRELLEEMARAIESGSTPDDLEAKLKDNPAFESLLSDLGCGKANELIEKHGKAAKGFRRLVDAANELRDGNLSKLQGGEMTLALAALEEAGNVANQITGSVRGIFKGRNIRARLGTKVTVFAAEDHSLKTPVTIEKS